jgi:hypothetical protein
MRRRSLLPPAVTVTPGGALAGCGSGGPAPARSGTGPTGLPGCPTGTPPPSRRRPARRP